MVYVLDFSKEASRHLEHDSKTLYLKQARTEDTHFKALTDNLRALKANDIDLHNLNHSSRYKRKWVGWAAAESSLLGVLDMVGCVLSSLRNKVHPLFRSNRFDQHI
jgi:hypothetical protein